MGKIVLKESQFQNMIQEMVKRVLKESRRGTSTGTAYVYVDEIEAEVQLDFEYKYWPGYPGSYYDQPEPASVEIYDITIVDPQDYTPEDLEFLQNQIDSGMFDENCEDTILNDMNDYDNDPYGGDGPDD